MGRDRIARAKDNCFTCRRLRASKPVIRAVAGWVRGTEESDSRRTKGDGEMKRTRVPTDDAECVAQKSHQLAEFAVVQERRRIAARCTNRSGQIILPGAVVYDTAQTDRLSQPATQFPEALRRPAFRPPATTRTQNDVSVNTSPTQISSHG